MNRMGSWRTVPRTDCDGRLANGRAFLRAAEELMALSESDRSCNPIITQCVDAAIAYGDAVSIKFGGIVNKGDHQQVGDTIRHAIGERFPESELRRLGQILGEKDDAAYGAHSSSQDEAREVLKLAVRFGQWAEAELGRPG